MLQTDTRVGLTSEEVLQRRRKYGLNQMKYVSTTPFLAVSAGVVNGDASAGLAICNWAITMLTG